VARATNVGFILSKRCALDCGVRRAQCARHNHLANTCTSASRVHADGSSTEQKQGEYRCVFVCGHAQRGGERLVSDWRESPTNLATHTQHQQGKKLSSNFLSKSWKVSCFCCAILQFLTLHRRLFVCTRTSYVIKRQASTTGGAPPSGAPTIGTVCVGGWVCGRRCKRVFSRSSGEETRIIFNPTCRRGDLQQVFMRWT